MKLSAGVEQFLKQELKRSAVAVCPSFDACFAPVAEHVNEGKYKQDTEGGMITENAVNKLDFM